MGIIYNRFLPDSGTTPLIIPYSNRANILSYLTYDNFVGGTSPWGSEWPLPMNQIEGMPTGSNANWQKRTADEAIRLYAAGTNPKYYYQIGSSLTFNGCTFYIVCKYSTADKNPRFYTYNYNNNYAYVFTSGREPGSNFNVNNWGKGAQYFQLDSKMHDYYNVYAVNYYYDSTNQTFDVFAMFNLFTLKWAQQSGQISSMPCKRWVKSEAGSMDIKFIAIVEGKESDDTIIKNVHNIMKYFNINDGRYW